jgi:hypothetical protein
MWPRMQMQRLWYLLPAKVWYDQSYDRRLCIAAAWKWIATSNVRVGCVWRVAGLAAEGPPQKTNRRAPPCIWNSDLMFGKNPKPDDDDPRPATDQRPATNPRSAAANTNTANGASAMRQIYLYLLDLPEL